jgi:phosphatidylinositol-4,5-bisphosphate 3-kinase
MHVLRVSGCRLPADRSWPSSVFVFVECALYFGGALLCAPQCTVPQPFDVPTGSATFDGTPLAFQVVQTKMPKGARACLTVYACASGSRDTNVAKAVPLAWLGVQCFDWNDRLVQGDHQCRLWAGAADPIGTCTENFTDKRPMRLVFGFRRYEKTPVYSPPTGALRADKRATGLELTPSVLAEIEKDSLEALSETIKPELWRVRWCLRDRPRALAKLLQCVRWWEPADVAEAHALVREWRPLSSTDALELFDARYADPAVRAYAVERLFTLSDGALVDLLLQLVQVIKYEPYHDSPLARFLVHRALQAKDIVGYPLFWHLRSEAHVPEISQRFLLLTETYLRGCGRVYRNTLVDQVRLLSELNDVGSRLVAQPAEARARFLQVSLVDMRFPPRFSLPLFTDYECSGLELEKCRFMKSKKMPLWLTFANADVSGSPVTVMFKVGDDLRQDVLTLQMIKLMDKLWTAAGMNLGMTPYGVVATGPERGLVEVVLNSETMANINRKAGGAAQVFNPNVLVDWLREHNATDELFRDAQQRFALSAAGYAVATYVLGVGDRHNDNIMLNKNGAMFHIDFGHFLGHFKTKFGYEREKAPFVFTKQYAQILGGRGAPAYELFVTSACKAFNIVRKNCMLFINLFTMMISVGLPELRSRENVVYLRDMLVLEKSDADAERFLKGLIDESLRSFNTQVGEVVHILAN